MEENGSWFWQLPNSKNIPCGLGKMNKRARPNSSKSRVITFWSKTHTDGIFVEENSAKGIILQKFRKGNTQRTTKYGYFKILEEDLFLWHSTLISMIGFFNVSLPFWLTHNDCTHWGGLTRSFSPCVYCVIIKLGSLEIHSLKYLLFCYAENDQNPPF